MISFKDPYILLFIPILIFLFFKKIKNDAILVPSILKLKEFSKKTKKHLIGKSLIFLSLFLMIIALARPQSMKENKEIKKNGIDIVIALDLSKSMLAKDFQPNRLEKSKEILREFLKERPNDRVSLVVFGGDAYTKVPLTFDHNVVDNILSTITTDDITSNNKTAIGMGLGVSLNRLKNSTSKSKVVILMTDGENNSGEMSPIGAAKLAKEMGVRVYTIGIGAKEIAIPSFFGTSYVKNKELDENLLNNIAKETNGIYFRASNEKEFKNIFKSINKLEKTEINSKSFYEIKEYYIEIIKAALILLLLGVFFQYLLFIRIP